MKRLTHADARSNDEGEKGNMDIGRVYGRYLPLVPGQTPAARSDPKRSFFGTENLMLNRTNAYASSGRQNGRAHV